MRAAGFVFAALSLVVVGFHIAVLFGARLGHLTMGGRWQGALPIEGRVAAVFSALLILAMASVVLGGAGIVRNVAPGFAIWVVVGLLSLSALAHVVTPSAAERALWLPQILVMLAASLVVAVGG